MRRHELDLFSLVAGILFVAIATAHIIDASYTDTHLTGRWVVPALLVVLGGASLLGLLRGRGGEAGEQARGEAHDEARGAAGEEDPADVDRA